MIEISDTQKEVEKNFRENLRRILKERNWTQRYLFEMIGMDKAGFSLVINGHRGASMKTMCAVSEFTEIPLWELIAPVKEEPKEERIEHSFQHYFD